MNTARDPVGSCARALLLAMLSAPVSQASLSAQTQFVSEPVIASAPSALLGRMVTGDFDGDGDLDVFGTAVQIVPFTPYVYLRNDGRGRLANASAGSLPPLATMSGFATVGMVAFDMDGDGDLDLLAGDSSATGHSVLLRNNGGAVFTDASIGLPAGSTDFIDTIAGDFDGDGDQDLVVIESLFSGGQRQLLRNGGTGVFTVVATFAPVVSSRVASADFDGDGDLDLAFGEQGGVRLYRNDGAFSFTDVTASWLPSLAGSNAFAPYFGDIDGDGDADLIVTRSSGPVDDVLRNNGGSFSLLGGLPTAGTGSAVLVDADDDGDLDLVRAEVLGSLLLDLNGGAGVFVPAPSRLPAVATAGPYVTAGDLDGDGDPDLLLSSWLTQGLAMLRNRHRHLMAGPAVLGQTWTIDVWSTPGYASLDHLSRLGVALARLPQPLQVPGFGALWLDLGAGHLLADAIVPATVGVHSYGFALPLLAPLIGIELHVQTLLEQAPAPAHFTGFDSVLIQ